MISNYAILAKHVNHDMYVYRDILKIAMKKKAQWCMFVIMQFLVQDTIGDKKMQ